MSPTADSAMPTSENVWPSIHSAADAAAIAQSPARRSTFSCALPAPGRTFRRTSVSSSPSLTAVVYGPTWKPAIGTTRSPPLPRMTTSALAAAQTAERSSAAHHRVGDDLLGVGEQREVAGEQLGLQEVDVAGERADADLAVLLADVGELREIVDVDQVLGVGEPQLHHRQQAVAAGDDPRLGTEPLERRDRALDARRTFVLEWRGGLQPCSSRVRTA